MSTRPDIQQLRSRRRNNSVGTTITVAFYIAATIVTVPALHVPDRVDRLIIDNPHPWAVNVDVTDTDRHGWIGIGTVQREREQTFGSIIDQGDEWTIRFTYSTASVEVILTGFQLERRGWRVTVPDEFADELRSAHVPETPP